MTTAKTPSQGDQTMAQRGLTRIAYRDSHGGWFVRRRLMASVLAAGVGALVALPLPAARASTCEPSTCIPAGTPYAAEVRIALDVRDATRVKYVGKVTDQCTDAPQPYKSTDFLKINAQVTFRQVTVPLLTKAELGKAYKRLHVRPTVTTAGPVTGFGGGFRASGTGPYGVDCAPKSFDTGVIDLRSHQFDGDFAQTELAGFDDLFLDGIGDEAAWIFSPPSYTDNNQSTLNVAEQANNVLEDVPPDTVAPGKTYANFGGMTIGDRPGQFSALLHRATLTIKARYESPDGGVECASLAKDCRVEWEYVPDAVLTRLHIYKTQKDYAK